MATTGSSRPSRAVAGDGLPELSGGVLAQSSFGPPRLQLIQRLFDGVCRLIDPSSCPVQIDVFRRVVVVQLYLGVQ